MGSFEVFSYWNMTELQLTFNAVASIVGGGDFLGLLRTISIVGLLSMAMAVLAGFSQLPDFGRWIVMLAVFNGMLLVPKVNVLITDRTGSQAPIVVSGVPMGLAGFASSISHIGDWLTRTYETTFAVIPNDMSFVSHGALWGQRVQQEVLHTKFSNSILQTNLLDFYRECVVPEFATGFVVASDMAKSTDLWVYLNGKTNPGRLVTVRAMAGSAAVPGTYGCDAAYIYLTDQVNVDSANSITSLSGRLFPKQAPGTANAAMISSIQTSTNYILGVSQTAMESVRQTAMTNFMLDAQYNLPAQIGDSASAATNLAQAQAIRSTSDSYKLMAKIGESTMPKIKNIVEIVQYAVFPIIILLVLMAGHKGGLVLKAYVMSLVWVQLWPPLYAVMSMIMTLHAQELATMTAGMGLSMADYSLLNNAYISDEAIAGMIAATAIPTIAMAIVKGGDVGAQAISGAMSGASQQATQAATAASQGNFNMGNASLGNGSANNLSMGKMNTRSEYTHGGMSDTGADGVSHFHGSQGEVINDSAARQNTALKVDWNGKSSSSLQKAATESEKAAFSESDEASHGIAAAKQSVSSFEKGHAKDNNAQTSDQVSAAAQTISSYADETAIAAKAAEGKTLTGAQAAEVEAHARAEVSGGIHIPFVGGVDASAGGGVTARSSSTTQQMNQMLSELTHNKKYGDAVQKTNSAMHSDTFTQGDVQTVRAAQGIRASLDSSMSHISKSQANHEKALDYQAKSAQTKERGAGFSVSDDNRFMTWATNQNNSQSGKNYTPDEIASLARGGDRDVLEGLAQRYSDEKLAPAIDKGMAAPTNAVAARHEANKGLVPDEKAVQAFNNQNQGEVIGKQEAAGVNPNTGPTDHVSGQVKQQLLDAGRQINLGKSNVDAEGKPIHDKAAEFTDSSKGSNLFRAGANALPSVVGSDATKLLDRGGLIPMGAEAAQKVADKNTGTLTENIVGAAVDVGLMVGGGAIGRGIGSGAEKLFKLGKGAGEAAAATERTVLTAVEEKAAARAATRAEAVEGGATKGSEKAVEERADKEAETKLAADERIAKGADKGGAKAQVETQATATGAGKVAGVVAGAGVGVYLSGEHGIGDNAKQVEQKAESAGHAVVEFAKNAKTETVAAARDINEGVIDIGKDVADKVSNIGKKIVE